MSASGIGAVVSPLVLKIIGGVVTVVWVFSIALDAFNPSYDPPDTIGLAFMAMLSAVLGAAAVRGKDEKAGENPERREANRQDREEDNP